MPIDRPEDMAKVPVNSPQQQAMGQVLPMGAISEVTFDHPPLIGDAIINGKPGLLLVLEKFPAAGTENVTEDVERVLKELSAGLPGVTIDTNYFRLASYVDDSLGNLERVIKIGVILLIFVIALFLFNWRSVVISLASMLVSVAAAVAVLYVSGATINAMILAGLILAFGVIIDDALIDLKRFSTRLRSAGTETGSALQLIRKTSLETRKVASYCVLILTLALIPVFLMGGMSGAFF